MKNQPGHPYEYQVLVEYITPVSSEEPLNYSEEVVRQALALKIQHLTGSLSVSIAALPDGGGWEINSHNIAIAGNTVIFTILLQRPRKPEITRDFRVDGYT